jgi:hypothetical protein
LLFLDRKLLERGLDQERGAGNKQKRWLPVVLTHWEVRAMLERVDGLGCLEWKRRGCGCDRKESQDRRTMLRVGAGDRWRQNLQELARKQQRWRNNETGE